MADMVLRFTRIALVGGCCLALVAADEGSVKESLKNIVSGVVNAGKDAVSGIQEGLESGGAENGDKNAGRVVSDKKSFDALLSASVVKAEDLGKDAVRLTVAIRNDNNFVVKVTNLSVVDAVVLLDKSGFSYPLDNPAVQGKNITAIGKSLTRAKYVFSNVEEAPTTLRFLHTDLKVPALERVVAKK